MRQKGFIPRDFINRLVAEADIVNIINMRVPLKKAGRNYKACCPFHDEKTPSFNVNEQKQFYYCFGCGVGGTVIDFIMEYERLEFMEAIEVIAGHEGLEIPYERTQNYNPEKADHHKTLLACLSQANVFFQQQLRYHPERTEAVNYLKERGLNGEDANKFAIGYAPDSWGALKDELIRQGYNKDAQMEVGLLSESNYNQYDRFRDRIIFPIRNRRGDTIGFGGRILGDGEPKYLNSPETILFKKGSELYGLYELRKYNRHYERVIVVEGYMDVVMLSHFGVTNAVATLGTAISSTQIEILLRYTSQIVFCFDGDRAGRDAANKALEESLSVLGAGKELMFLFLPEEHDPDSYIKAHGKEGFEAAIAQSIPLSQYLFTMLQERIDLSTMEGRSQLLSEAGELINRMRDTPLRDLMRDQLAKETSVTDAVLNRHVEKGRPNNPRQHREPINFHRNITIVERILMLLLNNLSLAHRAKGINFLIESNDREQNLLYQIIVTLQDYEMSNLAQLLMHFKDEPWIERLEQLSMQETMLFDEEQQIAEFEDLFKQLAKEQSPLNRILEKMRNNEPLTDDEKAILRQR